MERWKLHDNISRNGYGNAMIGRYGGSFEQGIWWVYDTGEKCAVLVSHPETGPRRDSRRAPIDQGPIVTQGVLKQA